MAAVVVEELAVGLAQVAEAAGHAAVEPVIELEAEVVVAPTVVISSEDSLRCQAAVDIIRPWHLK